MRSHGDMTFVGLFMADHDGGVFVTGFLSNSNPTNESPSCHLSRHSILTHMFHDYLLRTRILASRQVMPDTMTEVAFGTCAFMGLIGLAPRIQNIVPVRERCVDIHVRCTLSQGLPSLKPLLHDAVFYLPLPEPSTAPADLRRQ
jgi:hypothetical protein